MLEKDSTATATGWCRLMLAVVLIVTWSSVTSVAAQTSQPGVPGTFRSNVTLVPLDVLRQRYLAALD